jgi:cytochrome c-type biogenesis protein CcmH
MRLLRILLILIFGLLLSAPSSVQAQGGTPETPTDDEVNAIAKQLYCPVCENVPLDVCGTLACQRWREQIADLLAQGQTEQEIKDYFVLQYGDQVLAAPPARGLNWLIYVLPPLAILAGGYWLASSMRRWRAQSAATRGADSAPPPEPEDEYQKQLEDELEARR